MLLPWLVIKDDDGQEQPPGDKTEGDDALLNPSTIRGIVEIPAKLSFADSNEGATALGYGAANDHVYTQANYKRIAEVEHLVALTPVGQNVQAHVISSAKGDDTSRPRTPEGTFFSLHVNVPGDDVPLNVAVFVINSALTPDRLHGHVLLLVVGKSVEFLTAKGLMSTDMESPDFFNCELKMRVDDAVLKRKINAIKQFDKNPKGSAKFLPVFLNQRPHNLPQTNPFAAMDQAKVKWAKDRILGHRQLNQAAFLVLIGRSVLLLGPTNESNDNLLEKFVKLLQELGMDELNISDVKPIRVYRPMQERSAAERSSIDENAEEEKLLVGEKAGSEGEKEKPLVEYTEDAKLEGGVPLL
ncbi:MAG: hypothetical protein Q9208_000016 [Pyrenodesmia sp. 3 TL-2023]